MTVRLFVPLAATLIFGWLATTYFWTVPVESYLHPGSPSVTAAGQERKMAASAAEGSAYLLTTESAAGREGHKSDPSVPLGAGR